MDSSPKNFDPGTMSTPSTPSRRLNRRGERLKMLSQITILDGTMDGKINISLKIEDCSFVDDNSLALLALPDGPFMKSDPIQQTFHSFVITVQNGQRIYGGSYIFGLKQIAKSQETDEHKVVYISRALVALTIRPLVDQLKKLLGWCVNEGGCNPRWLRCLTNIPLPQKGRFIIIELPDLKNLNNKLKLTDDHDEDQINIDSGHQNMNAAIIFRPFNVFPLFDYSFRFLLTQVITFENLLLLYSCALNELQVLIVSNSYYNLMLISECLIALLNPFKWQHVYVPILPSKLGLHYLDAPTPFIMGINSRLRGLIKPNRIACYFDCDSKKLELNVDPAEFIMPPFIEDLRNDLADLINYDTRLITNISTNEALKRVSEIAHKYNVIQENYSDLDEIKLNQSIRILFFNKLKKCILNKYQHCIVCVSDPKEQQVKFDAVSYLSDQPLSMRPFLQKFVETQMFATFIDEAGKTMAKQKRNDRNETIDSSYYLAETDYEPMNDSIEYWHCLIDARFENAQHINLVELEDLCGNSQNNSVCATPCSPFKKRIHNPIHSGGGGGGGTPLKNVPSKMMMMMMMPSSPAKQVVPNPNQNNAPTNWKVVETLMKEVKNKTKKILLAKMGSDELGTTTTTISSSSPSISPEDNTLITALCDLIERIWSHGKTNDNNVDNGLMQPPPPPPHTNNRCPFWTHVTAYFQYSPGETANNRVQSSLDKLDLDDLDAEEHEPNSGSWMSIKKRIDSLSQLSLDQTKFLSQKNRTTTTATKSIPSTLSYDYKSICDMTDIKTEVGKSRAFIRLALERKLLSKHLRTLLYNQDLLNSLYKRYAFLRCEDEREQFLTHLLTLNAVDLYCFTHTFTTSTLPYTLVVGASNFTGWISMIIGSSNQTKDKMIPMETTTGQQSLVFKHKNFGHIYTLSLMVKPGQKVFVEQCFLRNDVTNALFKFECGKWLGKNIDDGSMERMLVGELVSGTINDHIKRSGHVRSSSIGRNWSRNYQTESVFEKEKYSIEDLQSLLGESINQIMKLYFVGEKHRPTNVNDAQHGKHFKTGHQHQHQPNKLPNSSTLSKITRNKHCPPNTVNMIGLLFGPRRFLWILTQVFYYGFKNRKSFRKQTFIWDYILRVQCELKLEHVSKPKAANESMHVNDFIKLIDSITNKAETYGKDMKFQLFIFLSLRDHKLSPYFLKLLLRPQLLQIHFEPESFLRDPTLLTFLIQILKTFNEIELKLDKDVTKNL